MSHSYLNLKNRDYPVYIRRSRRKTLSLNVTTDGSILIKAPLFFPEVDIHNFINRQKEWISQIIDKNRKIKRYSFNNGSEVPFLGRGLIISSGSQFSETLLKGESIIIPYGKRVENELESFYRNMAREIIEERVKIYADILGVEYNRISIKAQKTRWGSCSGKGNLNFNWKVILTPFELVNYLVIHEVCHLKEMNHSKEFWKQVEQLDPDYIEHRRELQNYGYFLTTFL